MSIRVKSLRNNLWLARCPRPDINPMPRYPVSRYTTKQEIEDNNALDSTETPVIFHSWQLINFEGPVNIYCFFLDPSAVEPCYTSLNLAEFSEGSKQLEVIFGFFWGIPSFFSS